MPEQNVHCNCLSVGSAVKNCRELFPGIPAGTRGIVEDIVTEGPLASRYGRVYKVTFIIENPAKFEWLKDEMELWTQIHLNRGVIWREIPAYKPSFTLFLASGDLEVLA